MGLGLGVCFSVDHKNKCVESGANINQCLLTHDGDDGGD